MVLRYQKTTIKITKLIENMEPLAATDKTRYIIRLFATNHLPQDTLSLSLHPDCNSYLNPNRTSTPTPANPNLDVEGKCREILGHGVKCRGVKSPFPKGY
jgi:hypothetical protein